MTPRLTVSIVSHGNAPLLPALLDSLRAQEQPPGLQLIVTDNLGNDLPFLDPSPWHSLTLLRNEIPRGFAENHNAASRLAQAEYFCILNPDVTFTGQVFEPLIRRIEAGEGDIVSPLVVDPRGQVQDSFRSLPTPLELFRRGALGRRPAPMVDSAAPILPDWIAGFFMLMRTSLYASLGGMDARYRLYLEDAEFCTRARLAGYKVLVDPALRLQHDARRASRTEFIYLAWHIGSALRFFTSPVYRQARRLALSGGSVSR